MPSRFKRENFVYMRQIYLNVINDKLNNTFAKTESPKTELCLVKSISYGKVGTRIKYSQILAI